MPNDTTHCANHQCTLRETCYRYHLHTKEKSYAWYFQVEQDENGNCKYYLKTE